MKSRLLTGLFLLLFITSRAQFTAGGMQLSADSTWSHTSMTAMNSQNSAWVVWCGLDTTYGKGSIYLSGFNNIGYPLSGYSEGAIAIGTDGDYYMPQIVMSDDSEIIVTWYGYADSTSTYSHIYIQKYSSSGAPLWNDGVPVRISTTADTSQNKLPQIASDKNGGAYVCWTRYDQNVSPSSGDVVLERIGIDGNIATGWPAAPLEVAALPGTTESHAKIAVTPTGDALYVQYLKGLSILSSWIKRINAADGTTAAGFTGASGAEISQGPNLTPFLLVDNFIFCDTSGNALSIWTEARNSGNGEIYFQKTSVTGVQTFALNGRMIAGKPGTDGFLYMYAALDDDGSILAAWNDYTSTTVSVPTDIGCVKFKPDASATNVWQHTITPITYNGTSSYPKILPDHLGGSYIFYDDYTNYPTNLNCLRLSSSGALLWPLPGLNVGLNYDENGSQPQFDFLISNVNSVQTNVTWEYKVNGLYDIYACNVLPSKQSCFDIPEGISTPEPSGGITIYPNPSRNRFTVAFSEAASSESSRFELYNEMGMLVLQQPLRSSTVVSTVGLSAGFYFGKVVDEKGNCLDIKKIILQ